MRLYLSRIWHLFPILPGTLLSVSRFLASSRVIVCSRIKRLIAYLMRKNARVCSACSIFIPHFLISVHYKLSIIVSDMFIRINPTILKTKRIKLGMCDRSDRLSLPVQISRMRKGQWKLCIHVCNAQLFRCARIHMGVTKYDALERFV